MIPHLLRCQGLAVNYYGFALGRLEYGAPSTFAQLGYNDHSKETDDTIPYLNLRKKNKHENLF